MLRGGRVCQSPRPRGPGLQPFLDLILQRRSGMVICHCNLHDATLLFYLHCTVWGMPCTIGNPHFTCDSKPYTIEASPYLSTPDSFCPLGAINYIPAFTLALSASLSLSIFLPFIPMEKMSNQFMPSVNICSICI